MFGYDEITRQYYDRYRLPVMHTETNIAQGPNGDEAVYWLWKEWANVLRVRNDGVPDRGLHLVLADRPGGLGHGAARERTGASIRWACTTSTATSGPSGEAYKQLIADWKQVLPTRSACLQVPVSMPSDYASRHNAERRRPPRKTSSTAPPRTPTARPTRPREIAMDSRFEGRVAMVTGGASGIGLATVDDSPPRARAW